jgi:hypothetical protein
MLIHPESPQSDPNEFKPEPDQEAEEQSSSENSALSIRDKLFLYASGTEIMLGLLLIYLPFVPLFTIVPSILIGSGIATFVYRFMGGIKQNDSLVMGGMKIGGALASLLASAIVVNTFLSEQVKETELSFEPAQRDVLVVRKSNGELVNLEVELKKLRKKYEVGNLANLTDTFKSLNPIKSSCLDGKGVCEDKWKDILLTVQDGLAANQASVCQEYARELDQIPIQITPRNNLETGNIALVSITDKVKIPCQNAQSHRDRPTRIYISSNTATKLGIGNLKPGQTIGASARIAPLRGILIDLSMTSPAKISTPTLPRT